MIEGKEVAQVCAAVSAECQFDRFNFQTVWLCKLYSPYKYPSMCLSEKPYQVQRGIFLDYNIK